jgi:hypothetical protein
MKSVSAASWNEEQAAEAEAEIIEAEMVTAPPGGERQKDAQDG